MDTRTMDTALMTNVLMLHGDTRHCGDCGTETVFLPVETVPVEDGSWVCTACDAAVLLTPWDSAA